MVFGGSSCPAIGGLRGATRGALPSLSTWTTCSVDCSRPSPPILPMSAPIRRPETLLVRSDLTGTMQLYELSPPGGLRQVTALADPVGTARYVPGDRRAVIEVDRGGNERHQLYLVDLEAPLDTRPTGLGPTGLEGLHALTDDPRYGHHIAGISGDGRLLAYLSNRANGVDFDLWFCDLVSGDHRCVCSTGSWCQPASGFSPDGRLISIERPGPRPLDVDLLLVDTQTGEVRVVLEHPDEAAVVGPPAWVGPTSFFVSSNVGSDHAKVVHHDLATGAVTHARGNRRRVGCRSDREPQRRHRDRAREP